MLRNKSGITLVEIMVATTVLSIVFLTAGTVYVSSIKELNRCVDEVKIQRQASFALDHIFLHLLPAQGIVTAVFPSSSIVVTVDSATNTKIKYSLSGTNLIYDLPYTTANPPVGSSEIIATGITALTFDRPLTKNPNGTGVAINNYFTIDITATGARGQASYSTGVALRGMSG